MLRAIWKLISRALLTAAAVDIICSVWRWIEVEMYGTVQYRKVDDIIMFIMIPIIYMAVASLEKD